MVTVTPRVDGELTSVNFKEGEMVKAGQLLATIDARRFENLVQRIQEQLQLDQANLVLAKNQEKSGTASPSNTLAFEAKVAADQANARDAEAEMEKTRVTAPIAGLAGLLIVQPGNIVHPNDGLVTIAQIQPIAVLFTLPQDFVSKLRSRIGEGAGPTVEAWNRDSSA
jgi:multidrug efflux system membrane fusion protein